MSLSDENENANPADEQPQHIELLPLQPQQLQEPQDEGPQQPNGMLKRVEKIERTVEKTKEKYTQSTWVYATLLAQFVFLFAFVFGHMYYISGQFSSLDAKFTAQFSSPDAKFTAQFSSLDAKFTAFGEKMDRKFTALEDKFTKLSERVGNVEVTTAATNAKLDVLMYDPMGRIKLAWPVHSPLSAYANVSYNLQDAEHEDDIGPK